MIEFYIAFALIIIWTVKMLPFISVDAYIWLHLKMQELDRWVKDNDE